MSLDQIRALKRLNGEKHNTREKTRYLKVETPASGNLVTNLISFLKSVLDAFVSVRYIQTQNKYQAEKCSKLLLLRGAPCKKFSLRGMVKNKAVA